MFSLMKDADLKGGFVVPLLIGGGLVTAGYHLGKRFARASSSSDHRDVVSKSFYTEGSQNPVLQYCVEHSTAMHPVQKKLISETLRHPWAAMMGAPEVVSLNGALIKMLHAKKVLDIGVFTGASSLAAALALPPDGVVVACDVDVDFTNIAKKFWKEAEIDHKINLVIGDATKTLDNLIAEGESNTFDFAFIDADKTGYDSYYERCLKLLRPGGAVAFDNTLWKGRVLPETNVNDPDTVAIRRLNEKIAADVSRVFAVQMNIGDGYTLVVKL